jgi:Ni/Fe-hydrogenase subunit HybB-like protein
MYVLHHGIISLMVNGKLTWGVVLAVVLLVVNVMDLGGNIMLDGMMD